MLDVIYFRSLLSLLMSHLGGTALAMPVEIVPFCWEFTLRRLEMLFIEAGCVGKSRVNVESDEPYVTDNGNYIIDLYFKSDMGDLKAASDAILRLAGVVEHGIFLDMATTVIVAGKLGVLKFIVIVDESKLVSHLGGTSLAMPVEIVPFCWEFTLKRLEMLFIEAGCVGKLRVNVESGQPYVTDNGNYIIDLYFKSDMGDLKAASDAILRLAGVVEHGIFLDMALL
ncbi:probable ribose-5-phosphate isomerase 1 [Lycium barbarum]|uniref:probable ribose-5-phosphate isomerase 1 n=1 Tax=Lycium barbarum TaxID=112863 RepID=UPI00293EFB4B|nr:probable ribose-5-phosphate isomerase 1 [Lycium barbarum]